MQHGRRTGILAATRFMTSTPMNGVIHDYLLALFRFLFIESPAVYNTLFSVEAALAD